MIPRIYPITDTRISGLSHLEQVRRLVVGGATLIQLREKDASPRDLYRAASDCVAFARPRGVKIIVNDRADIALLADADGVHLGQDDLPPLAARAVLGPGKLIGYSTHSVEQATAAAGFGVDYIAVGPIFGTRTKRDPDPSVGLAGIVAARSAIGGTPLVAIGGIDPTNIAGVFAAGADSVAMVSAILAAPDGIENATRDILRATDC